MGVACLLPRGGFFRRHGWVPVEVGRYWSFGGEPNPAPPRNALGAAPLRRGPAGGLQRVVGLAKPGLVSNFL